MTQKPLVLTLNPTQAVFPVGELPSFEIHLQNSSQEAVRFCRYKLDYRLKAAMILNGPKNYEAQPFVTQSWPNLGRDDIILLQPGQTIEHSLTFKNDPIFGLVRRAKQGPVVMRSSSVKGFEAGNYEVSTALSNKVGIYIGQNGVFDRNLEGRRVPHEWPGIADDCYAALIEGSAKVKFE